eukprot:5246007-Pyramimonas_sp.AAC.1
MPVDSLTKDDFTKGSVAFFDCMTSGRLVLVDEGAEVERRRAQSGLKSRIQAASRKVLDETSWISWKELQDQIWVGGGGGAFSSPPLYPSHA